MASQKQCKSSSKVRKASKTLSTSESKFGRALSNHKARKH